MRAGWTETAIFALVTNEIAFSRTFQYRTFLDFLEVVNAGPTESHWRLDLSHVTFAFPTGMAPLVATIQSLTNKGWHFDVVPPNDSRLDDYFETVGWWPGIRAEQAPPLRRGKTYVPLTAYDSHEELNPLIKQITHHLAASTVWQEGVLDTIGWVLNEIADNVLLHAGRGTRGWIQMSELPKKSRLEIVVVDCGIGVTESLREAIPGLQDDREALQKAIQQGVTRNLEVGQGNGLAGSVRLATAANGWANLHSGQGMLRVMPDTVHLEQGPHHAGTLVEVTLPTDKPIDVAGALWGYEPPRELEADYAIDGEPGVTLLVSEEASGFGNRDSARPVRYKLRNLITQFPNDYLLVDFRGVDLMSASFADELIGRLVKELGPTTFYSKVHLTNLSELARRTIDAVVAQRLST